MLVLIWSFKELVGMLTLGQTGTQETRDLLDESFGSNKGIVLASKLLDELLVPMGRLESIVSIQRVCI